MRDRVDRGRTAKGSSNGQSKLTESDVRQIKQLLKQKLSLRSIADMFGVGPIAISDIKRCKTWKQV